MLIAFFLSALAAAQAGPAPPMDSLTGVRDGYPRLSPSRILVNEHHESPEFEVSHLTQFAFSHGN